MLISDPKRKVSTKKLADNDFLKNLRMGNRTKTDGTEVYLYPEASLPVLFPHNTHLKVGHKLLMPQWLYISSLEWDQPYTVKTNMWKTFCCISPAGENKNPRKNQQLSSIIGSPHPCPHPDCTTELQAKMHFIYKH